MVPLLEGPGVLPDWESCWDADPAPASVAVAVAIMARELYLKFFIWLWTPDERYLDFEIRVWPGEPYFGNSKIHIGFKSSVTFQKWASPKVRQSNLGTIFPTFACRK